MKAFESIVTLAGVLTCYTALRLIRVNQGIIELKYGGANSIDLTDKTAIALKKQDALNEVICNTRVDPALIDLQKRIDDKLTEITSNKTRGDATLIELKKSEDATLIELKKQGDATLNKLRNTFISYTFMDVIKRADTTLIELKKHGDSTLIELKKQDDATLIQLKKLDIILTAMQNSYSEHAVGKLVDAFVED